MKKLRFASWRIVAHVLLLGVLAGETRAAEHQKNWVTLTDCQYVESENNDGDSFRVRWKNDEFYVRLYYVDAPERNITYPDRTAEQSKYFGITLDETMRAGEKAKDRVKEILKKGPFVVYTHWASVTGRSREERYYGIVEVDGKSLAEILLAEGLARAKGVAPNPPSGEKSSEYRKRLERLEQEAREKRLGAWVTSKKEKNELEAQR